LPRTPLNVKDVKAASYHALFWFLLTLTGLAISPASGLAGPPIAESIYAFVRRDGTS
jgi:hypothetical protein